MPWTETTRLQYERDWSRYASVELKTNSEVNAGTFRFTAERNRDIWLGHGGPAV
jgi:hypothetical protein